MKSGYVAVVGRANAGKSTLINVIVGEKVSIVSPKPQTTRERILGVYTTERSQIAFIDTPGLYKADNLLNGIMQKTAMDSTGDADVVLFVLDAHDGVSEKDKELVRKFSTLKIPFILALTKIDIMPESLLISTIKDFADENIEIVPVSSRRGKNVKELIKVIENALPDGDKLFEEDIVSDRSFKFMIAEIMREKILLKFDKEIPHGVFVVVNSFEERKDGKCVDISLDILCERDNHKAILIGKQGKAIKEVSSFARQEMEKFLGKKVFLKTYVKVENNWRSSAVSLKAMGFTDKK